jgi:hypothetical protein
MFQAKREAKVEEYKLDHDYDIDGPRQLLGQNGPLEMDEMTEALKRCKSHKAPSDDKVLNEMIKKGRRRLLSSILLLLNML